MNLNDKFTVEDGRVYLTGIQALVRLPLDQMRRDRRAGLNTGAFISGYEGSPLGGYDLALGRVRKLLDQHRIHFRPGVNEELAATSVFGTQILDVLADERTVDGVLGIWYGKGPGVDRSGDIFRHANLAGTGTNCAALVLAGDDHACKSSTIPHQSDFSLHNVGIPIFYPATSQDILDYGLLAIALSRYSGAWTSLKCVTEVCDGGSTVSVSPHLPEIVLPDGYTKQIDARVVAPITLGLEYETNFRRLAAVREFAKANKVNHWQGARDGAWLGIASAGKAWLDTAQALRDLGIHEADLERLGIRTAKFGMTFPLEPDFCRDFARGLRAILVVEEKRSFLELQLKDVLYGMSNAPAMLGKHDAQGKPLLPAHGELNPDLIARVLFPILSGQPLDTQSLNGAANRVQRIESISAKPRDLSAIRPPNFCSGCPHNRSTVLLPGQVAGGGIGCHTMAIRLTDSNRTFSFVTQMGGEGAPWIGMSNFVSRKHVFQNIGDGTYFHSGQLAIEACLAAGVNITFKILYNGHVAMTGGQMAEGALTVPQLTRKLEAEGVTRTVVLTEELERYQGVTLAANAELRFRDELPRTLAEMEKIPGVTAIIYDQECAAEKRRKRARGKMIEPTTRLMINEQVCEGCGDCVKQSNCMSLMPVATEYGQKMRIHQSSCNKDYSCALGDCPSFVTVKIAPGTGLRRPPVPKLPQTSLPEPKSPALIGEDGYRILMPGIGGTGVVTINALLATAAWIDGLSVLTLDQTGTAQKGGAVVSHLTLSRNPIEAPQRINLGNADVILGFDVMGAASTENIKCATPGRTTVVLNTNLIPTIDHIRSKQIFGPEKLIENIDQATTRGRNVYIDANRLAENLFGSHLMANVFLLGAAFQAGLIPISREAIEKAVQWNAVDVERNLDAFAWGRQYYENPKLVEDQTLRGIAKPEPARDLVEARVADLTAYQDAAYARGYREFVEEVVRQAPDLKDAVARNLYKLMAIKDEYEVARLLTSSEFEQKVRETWSGFADLSYNLHPPLLRQFGINRKLKLGSSFRPLLKILASCKSIRGTAFDLFGHMPHRRMERSLVPWYKDTIRHVMALHHSGNTPLAIEIASLPDRIRGYEQIKEESIRAVKIAAEEKLTVLRDSKKPIPVA